ncbi:hypothetical protein JNJ66_07765 [Candidatus Saccharibacteria bacterium]|nr:hypothetical protein [Candidatus Saccharibacteria bacterium]
MKGHAAQVGVRRHIHHRIRIIRGIRLWQLTLIAIFFTVSSVALLRANSIEAIKLFNDVKAADAALNDAETQKALKRLHGYVSRHMNTQLDRISLEKTYQRDYQAAVAKVTHSGSTNDAKYQEAELACRDELRRTASFPAYAQCVSSRVGEVASGQDPLLQADLPQPYRYQYSFISPSWSPDAAGMTLLAALVLWFIIAVRFGIELFFVLMVRRHDS